MNGNYNWSTRGQATHGDGGANAARYPLPRASGGGEISAIGNNRAPRGGADNSSMPSFGGTSSTQSTNNSASNGASAPMSRSRATTPSSDRGSDGAFDNKYVSRGTGLVFGDAPLWNDVGSGKALSQAPQQPAGHSSRRDSFASNATFATQLPMPAAFQDPLGQNNAGRHMDTRNMNSLQWPNGQHARGNGPQFRSGIDASVNGINAAMGNIRVTDNGSPSRQQHGYNSMIPSNGVQAAYNGSRGAPNHVGNGLYPGSQQEGRSKFFADIIRSGQTEDPYDRSMSRYDTSGRLQNPTLGPARFKDSKVFATVGDNAPTGGSGNPAATQMPSRDIVPMDKKKRPDWLDLAVQGLMMPSLEEAFDALPLTELCRSHTSNMAGVIRIKDIPYSTTRQEMIAFIGRNAQVLRQPQGSPYHSVHILMERESGKTQDCFIEVTSPTEAAWVARQFTRRVDQKRPPKVGDRVVEVLYSSQDELMVELLPRAKHVQWINGQPVVDRSERKYYAEKPAAGFNGFLHPEELVAMSKHATLSERSPYANKSPCRVYESMITLLYKYPWSYVDEITIAERRSIYDCTVGLMRTLIMDLRRASSNNKFSLARPTPALLQELVAAALFCPGFTEKQKAIVVDTLSQGGYKSMSDGRDLNIELGGRHPYSAFWPFSALGMPPDTDQEVLQYFASLFRRGTASTKNLSLAARKAAESSGRPENPMGDWKINYGPNANSLSLAQIGKIEFDEIERVLTRICSQRPQSPAGAATHKHAGAPGLLAQGSASGSASNSSGGSNRQNSGNFAPPSFY